MSIFFFAEVNMRLFEELKFPGNFAVKFELKRMFPHSPVSMMQEETVKRLKTQASIRYKGERRGQDMPGLKSESKNYYLTHQLYQVT
jgi:hypothetical protein